MNFSVNVISNALYTSDVQECNSFICRLHWLKSKLFVLKEWNTLIVFERRMPGREFGLVNDQEVRNARKEPKNKDHTYYMRYNMFYHLLLAWLIIKDKIQGTRTRTWEILKTYTIFVIFEGKRSFERPGHRRENNLVQKLILKTCDIQISIGLIWLRTDNNGGLLWSSTLDFHNRRKTLLFSWSNSIL